MDYKLYTLHSSKQIENYLFSKKKNCNIKGISIDGENEIYIIKDSGVIIIPRKDTRYGLIGKLKEIQSFEKKVFGKASKPLGKHEYKVLG